MLGALVILAVSFVVMGFTLSPEASRWSVSARMLLMGLGIGPTLPLYTLVMQAASSPKDLGVVTAASTFSRSLGQVLGLAFFGTLFAAALSGAINDRVAPLLTQLSPSLQEAVVGRATSVGAAGEGGATVAFDATAALARVRRALPGDARAETAVSEVSQGFKLAFTDAITLLFRVGTGLIVLGFAITWLMPDVPLRDAGHGGRDR